jgi:hypothetical protein
MSRLHVVLWLWRQDGFAHKYTVEHVNAAAAGLRRGMNGDQHRTVLVTNLETPELDPTVDTFPLWEDGSGLTNACGARLPSCYRRLKLFDPATQSAMGVEPGDRVCSLDIDSVVYGDLRPLMRRQEQFVGWAVRGARHPKVYNGSMWLFTAGDLTEMWRDFDPTKSPGEANRAGFMGSDQSWLSYKLARRTGCAGWTYPQVTSWPRELRMRRLRPAPGTGVVMFHGKEKPWHDDIQKANPWIRDLWGK